MTTETAASGTSLEPQPGSAAATTGAVAEGSTTSASDPLAGLDTGSREWVEKNGVKSFADAVKTAREAQSLIGRSVVLPDDKAKPEDLDKFYGRLGRPEKPEGYEFKLPESMPEGMAWDGEFAKRAAASLHKAGLSKSQAQAALNFWVGEAAEAHKAQTAAATKLQEEVKAKAVAATAEMEKAYGGKSGSDAFNKGINAAVSAIEALDKLDGVKGLKEAFESAGLLVGGLVTDSRLAIALSHIGRTLVSEDKLVTGGAAGLGETNPFAGTNATLQMQMIRSDPDKARKMISILGKKPEDFGWSGAEVKLPR